MHNNSWNCECSIFKLYGVYSIELRNITCLEKKIPIGQFKKDYCSSFFNLRLLIIIILSISFMCLTIGILIYLVNRYWFRIKIFLYTHKLGLWWITDEELSKCNKEYDIFLSFCHKDTNFVMEELLPKIQEREKSYKICIHFRDWEPGKWIHNNIIKSVAVSKCTVILLSENFIKSIWGMMEFRVAFNQMLKAKETKVVIILYGEIKKFGKLDFELQSYLQMVTYIKE